MKEFFTVIMAIFIIIFVVAGAALVFDPIRQAKAELQQIENQAYAGKVAQQEAWAEAQFQHQQEMYLIAQANEPARLQAEADKAERKFRQDQVLRVVLITALSLALLVPGGILAARQFNKLIQELPQMKTTRLKQQKEIRSLKAARRQQQVEIHSLNDQVAELARQLQEIRNSRTNGGSGTIRMKKVPSRTQPLPPSVAE